MITVTRTKKNGIAESNLKRGVNGADIFNLRPSTEGNLATAAIFEVNLPSGVETWYVSETYTQVLDAVTADTLEAGAEVVTNKVTSISGASTDVQYPSAKLLYDQLALKSPLASPTFTGTPAAPTAASGTNTTQVATTAFVQNKKAPIGTATGTDTYAVTLAPVITVATGALICVRFTNASTGASTLNVAAGGAVAIVKKDGSTAIGAGDIAANTWYQLLHDGTSWVALGI